MTSWFMFDAQPLNHTHQATDLFVVAENVSHVSGHF